MVVEFTLAFLLLVGSGFLIRSFLRLSSVAPGFDPTNVLTVNTELPEANYSNERQRRVFFLQILERLHALPGVRSAAVSTQLPFSGRWGSSSFLVEGQPEPPPGTMSTVLTSEVSPDYFHAMHIPLIAGRSFTLSEIERDSNVAIVSTAFARQFLPAGSPLSKRIRLGASDSPGHSYRRCGRHPQRRTGPSIRSRRLPSLLRKNSR